MNINFNQNNMVSLSKFESMLKTNNVYFFDSTEFEEIIQHYLDSGRQTLAYKAISLGLEQHPASVSLKILLAELFIYEDKFDEADLILTALHAIEPTNEEVYIQKANMFSKKDEHQSAIDSLKIALVYTDDKVDVLSMIGMEYLYLDKFDDARLSFAKCLDVDFEDYSSLYNVIYCFDMQNRHKDAVLYLKKIIDKDPYSEVAWHQLGRQHYILEEYNEALRAFDFAIVIDELFVGAYLEKAKTLEQLNSYEEAIDNYLVTNELEDPTAFSYYRIGECYKKLDKNKFSIKYYKKTVKEDPLLDKGWIALTNSYCLEKNYPKALYYINKALSIDESNTLYWRRYAEINLKLDFFEEVAKAFYNCIEYGDSNLDIFIGLADVLNFIGEFQEAADVLIKAKKLHPNNAEIIYRISCIYYILGEDEKAEKSLRKGLKIDFEYKEIIKELFPAVFELHAVAAIVSEYNNA
ncbi:MAG: tetratricopeptide (TPR) repeat protein [Urechidicola sp.]|jgi:tetratricopeptide (TPR) repeat protein